MHRAKYFITYLQVVGQHAAQPLCIIMHMFCTNIRAQGLHKGGHILTVMPGGYTLAHWI